MLPKSLLQLTKIVSHQIYHTYHGLSIADNKTYYRKLPMVPLSIVVV